MIDILKYIKALNQYFTILIAKSIGNFSLKGNGFRKLFLKYVTSLMNTVTFKI